MQVAKEASVQSSIDEFEVLAKCLDVDVAEAATEYVANHDAQLAAQQLRLEFLAEAGELVASSLDYRSTLGRLTGLVVPRLADWCAVHLEDTGVEHMPLSHVDPMKLDLLRDLYRRYPLSDDSLQGYPRLTRTDKSELVSEVNPNVVARMATCPDHLRLLRAIGTCSWLTVPLRTQQTTFGALTIAFSDSRRQYGTRDLALAAELARRAASAIDNARLFDLSQKERSRVEAAMRAKDEFVETVSHELRSPLHAILGWTRLLRRGEMSVQNQHHAIEVIERNAEAQHRLVADLLDASSIIRGELHIHLTQVDLTQIVEMAAEGVRPAAEAKGVRLEIETARDHAFMRGDGERLEQVTSNLLANAIKFTPNGGLVRLRLRSVASDLELAVEDDGQGIEPTFLPHLFDPFRQFETGPTRRHGGLGIGLSIARHIVELHDGHIEARSGGLGHGATFVVRLPRSPPVSPALGTSSVPATKQIEGPARVDLSGIRVLVVDDDDDAREVVACALENCGVEVRGASSAVDARAELDEFAADVIVSDIGMPGEDGCSLIRSVRTHPDPGRNNIPAIALTGFASDADRTRVLVAGFNQHVAKPVELADLANAIYELAGKSRR